MAAGNAQTQDHTIVQMHEAGLKYEKKPKIQKVPELLRRIQSNNGSEHPYSPMVVSIGPYHHGKPELMEMERVKLEFARLCFPSYSEEMYKTAINAGEARKFYSDGSFPTQFDDDGKFSEMMFLDSCFILHFISCFLSEKGTGMKPHLEGFVIRDLLLLENQVPFSVLEAVMDLGKGSSKKEEGCTVEKIKEFVGKVRHCPITDEKISRETVSKRISSKCNEIFGFVRSLCFRTQSKTVDPRNVIPKTPVHLVELFHTQFTKQNQNPSESQGQTWYCYRSAKELNNVGIHFRPSESNSFNDVTYKSYFFYGYLSLPPILIDDLSKSLLLNLAAYESCPDTPDYAFQVSSYIVFLDSLIDQAEDVKELRSKGVLLNSLGSDQELADLFNEISKYLVIHPQAFRDARNGIDRRYQNKVKKWITEWLNNHFSSPWTVIAFVGASVGLGLTAIETYQSFFPPPTPS